MTVKQHIKEGGKIMEPINYKNYSIKIENDYDSLNPRTEWDNLGTMYCFHSSYTLGDKHYFRDSEELREEITEETHIILPLYLYDHSGITINTIGFSCSWDSGLAGIIAVSKDKVKKEFNWKHLTKSRVQKIRDYLVGEVETYDHFLTGSVYGYRIESPDGEELDSCFGFYGSDHKESGLLEQAESSIDYHIKDITESDGMQTDLFTVKETET